MTPTEMPTVATTSDLTSVQAGTPAASATGSATASLTATAGEPGTASFAAALEDAGLALRTADEPSNGPAAATTTSGPGTPAAATPNTAVISPAAPPAEPSRADEHPQSQGTPVAGRGRGRQPEHAGGVLNNPVLNATLPNNPLPNNPLLNNTGLNNTAMSQVGRNDPSTGSAAITTVMAVAPMPVRAMPTGEAADPPAVGASASESAPPPGAEHMTAGGANPMRPGSMPGSGTPIYMAPASSEPLTPERGARTPHSDDATAQGDPSGAPSSPSLTATPVTSTPAGPAAPAATGPVGQPGVTLTPASATALQHAVRLVSSASGTAPTVSHVVLRLDPPGIGTVAVRLVSHGGEITVAVRADSAEAANAVAATREQVVQALASHGLTLGEVRVSTGGPDTGSAGQQTGQPGGQGSADLGSSAAGPQDHSESQPREFRAPVPTGGAAAPDDRLGTDADPAPRRARQEGTWL